MTLALIPGEVSLSQLREVYFGGAIAALPESARPQVERAARVVAKAAAGAAPVYGVNTGFGKLASKRVSPEETQKLQHNLILSHCCGVGRPLPEPVVRLMIVLKLASLGRGASGVRWELLELLSAMLQRGLTPVIPAQGSVGASGDLAPLAHLTAPLIGEGEAWVDGERLPGALAMQRVGLTTTELVAKEGLAMINGTQLSTALALAALFETQRLLHVGLVAGALSLDAAMGSSAPFRPELHELRGHPGQIAVARTLRALLEGSEIRDSHRENDERVQDPYCLRCQPQVMGACQDLVSQVARSMHREANAVTDNPLVLPETEEILSGGNFHAEPVAFAADQLALAVAEIGSIAERRIAMLVDPALNHGLPAFLSPDPGVNSGFMIAEVTAAALYSENKQRAAPASVDSTPTSANQEDHVSMAAHGARRLLPMLDNLGQILGIELLLAAQGVELRGPLKTSEPLQRVIERIRQDVPALGDDRYMAPDLAQAATLARSRELLELAGAELFPPLEVT